MKWNDPESVQTAYNALVEGERIVNSLDRSPGPEALRDALFLNLGSLLAAAGYAEESRRYLAKRPPSA